jgi:16S rRNA G966 N2-methylase RsmD
MKKPLFEGVSNSELVIQLEGCKKCEKKLPTWFTTPQIYYPPKIHIEQTSSERTAEFKSKLITGDSLVDLSGGLGVDSFYFSKVFQEVTHIESNPLLASIVKHNFETLKSPIKCIQGDSMEILKNSDSVYDCLYIDPSRRAENKKKVFLLSDCEPNVPNNLDLLWSKTHQILIKTSPLLDIKKGMEELQQLKQLWVVGIKNEVKELLWLLEKDFQGEPSLEAVNLESDQEAFRFQLTEEAASSSKLSEPLSYLYEPNSSVLKSGAFKCVGERHGVSKLHTNSHLYTSDTLKEFPGRRFKIVEVLPYHSKALREYRKTKVNVSTRNFKQSVAQIRKKHHLLDGGALFMFFTTNLKNKTIVVVCEKI